MSKYSRKQKPPRGGHIKICQTRFHPQEQAAADIQKYWDIITKTKEKISPGHEMMRIRLECYWEGREYAEAYNQRQKAKENK